MEEDSYSPDILLGKEKIIADRSDLFDTAWYARHYAAFVGDEDPIRHYLAVGQRCGFSPGPSFDAPAYLATNPDVAIAGLEPLEHFIQYGEAEGRRSVALTVSPVEVPLALSSFFDADWYKATYGGLVDGEPTAAHYASVGWREGLSPSPHFNAPAYLAANPDVAAADIEPLEHYLRCGLREERPVVPVGDGERARRRLEGSSLFDTAWYAKRYAAFVGAEDPIRHYLAVGRHCGFSPSPSFDAPAYLAANSDVAAAGLEPLEHFIQYGRAEGRHSVPLTASSVEVPLALSSFFDADWYKATYAGLVEGEPTAAHYASVGWREGLSPSPRFNASIYLAANPDVAAADMEPLGHYLRIGLREGRPLVPVGDNERVRRLLDRSDFFDTAWYARHYAAFVGEEDPIRHYLAVGRRCGFSPGPSFDAPAYLSANPDVAAAGLEPLEHFIQQGEAEGRRSVSLKASPAEVPLALSWFFDADWYKTTYAGLVEGEPTAAHYASVGWREGLSPSPRFNAPAYLAANPDVADHTEPLGHYLRIGLREGRPIVPVADDEGTRRLLAKSGLFDARWYTERHGLELNAEAAIEHYLRTGWKEGLAPSEWFDSFAYRARHHDVRDAWIEPLEHFVRYGAMEGRQKQLADVASTDNHGALPQHAIDVIMRLHTTYGKGFRDIASLLRLPLLRAVTRIARGRDFMQIGFRDDTTLEATIATILSGAQRSRIVAPEQGFLRERLLSVAQRLGVRPRIETYLQSFSSASGATQSRWENTVSSDWIVKTNIYDRDLRNRMGPVDLVACLSSLVGNFEILRLLQRLAFLTDELVLFDLPIVQPFTEVVDERSVTFKASDVWSAGEMDHWQSAAMARHWQQRGRVLPQYDVVRGHLTPQRVHAEKIHNVWWWFVGEEAIRDLLELVGLDVVEITPADNLDQTVLVLARKRLKSEATSAPMSRRHVETVA